MANLRTFYACQAVAVAPLIPDANNNYNGSVAGELAVKDWHDLDAY